MTNEAKQAAGELLEQHLRAETPEQRATFEAFAEEARREIARRLRNDADERRRGQL